jgi:hypothetical protein
MRTELSVLIYEEYAEELDARVNPSI